MCFETLSMARKVRETPALLEMARQRAIDSVERHRCMPPKYIVAWRRSEVPHACLKDGDDGRFGYVVMERGGRRRAARLLSGHGRRLARPYPVAYADKPNGMAYALEKRARPE